MAKKLTATAVVALIFLIAAVCGFVWAWCGGAQDGALWVAWICLAIAVVVAVLSKLLGGAWFTDNANGH